MLDAIKRFLQERLSAGTQAPTPAERERALRLAAAALLFEVGRADHAVGSEERLVMRAVLQSGFGLSEADADELMLLAEQESRSACSIYEFTHLVDQGFTPEQKKRVVELLWLVAFADAEKHPLEEHLVRRVAGLLHVPHPDFIDAKIRARRSAGA
jgi:uncharacterized tellurite resistance protein B-like protein